MMAHPLKEEKGFTCFECGCVLPEEVVAALVGGNPLDAISTSVVEAGPKELYIPDDLFDPIVGFDDIKEVLLRSLKSPRPVHQLLHGVPASAKTLFLLELERVGDARYTLGSSSTKAGLRQLLMEDQPQILLIDELDKGNRRDHSILLSVMETGLVVDGRYDRHLKVKLETRIFAGANSTEKLPQELLSRFGGGLRVDPYTPQEFLTVAERVLVSREHVDPGMARVVAKAVLTELHSRDVRDAIRVLRLAGGLEEVPRVVQTLRRRR